MGVRLQRIITYSIILIITSLFIYLLMIVNRDIKFVINKERGFLEYSLINEVRHTKSEIMAIFYDLTQRCKCLNNLEEGSISLEDIITDEGNLQYLDYISFVTVDNNLHSYNLYSNNFSIDMNVLYNLLEGKYKKIQEFVYSEGTNVYFMYPINIIEGKIYSALIIACDYERVVRGHLLKRLVKVLENELYKISIVKGEDIIHKESVLYDVIFELDDVFMLKTRDDYFKQIDNIIRDGHTYLVISHLIGGLDFLYLRKRLMYSAGLIILYFFIIIPLVYIFISDLSLKRNVERERVFTALVSHELKTPISAILLSGENLKAGVVKGDDDIKYFGSLITESAINLKKMIESILTISTMDSKDNDLEQNRESCKEIVGDVLENLSTLIDREGIVVNKDYEDGELSITCHRISITFCLQNLIENSILYGASNSDSRVLNIAVREQKRRRKDGVCFIIQDYGPGISSKESGLIFKRYYRGTGAAINQIPGSGLGLSISSRLVEKQGGDLFLHSYPKIGATFELWLPEVDR